MLGRKKYSQLRSFLARNDDFLVVAHKNPDGDTIGSTCALLEILKDAGKRASAVFVEEIADKYRKIVTQKYHVGADPDTSGHKAVICVDMTSPDRSGLSDRTLERIARLPLLNIDHHPDNQVFGTVNIVDPEAAAVGEILYSAFAGSYSWRISPAAATALMLSIVLDTGAFRYVNNSGANVFSTAAALLKLKADYRTIIDEIYYSVPLNFMKFQSEILIKHLRTAFEGKFAWASFGEDTLAKFAISKKDTEELIDTFKSIKGVEIAALLYRTGDGVRLSLRSQNQKYSVGKIARKLCGGGHELAAGAFMKGASLDEAEKVLLDEVRRILA